MNTQTIEVKSKTEIGTITFNSLTSTVTVNVTHYDYNKSVIMSYDTLLKIAIAIVENHKKPITIADLKKSGKI